MCCRWLWLVLPLVFSAWADASQAKPFAIQVVDAETGRGVPLVELRTVHDVRYVTDSHGLVAVDEPGFMGREVFFHVQSHGYQFPKDGFGYAGLRLTPTPGGEATIQLRRINVAQRLYRVTGAGIYRDSVILGKPVPLRHPLLNAEVLGSDSVINAIYQGRIYWFWGDTNRLSYPLGNFHVSGATSQLPGQGGLHPDAGIELEYFQGDDGFARPMAPLPGEGPTWLSSLIVFNGPDGQQDMYAHYVKIRNFLEVYQWGLVRLDDDAQQFVRVATFPLDWPIRPHGAHVVRHADENGVEYLYFARPFPLERVRATAEALADPEQYESFSPLLPGSTLEQPRLDRHDDGSLRYAWRRKVAALDRKTQDRLLREGRMRPDEALRDMRDHDSGRSIQAHRGSVCWNAYRNRWVMIFTEIGGESSQLGEVYYAEAQQLTGPWSPARKIVTHDRYSFYNPKQHAMLDQENGRIIYFEGTYTAAFSRAKQPTKRYDYNQIMYRLDLSDPRLALPATQ